MILIYAECGEYSDYRFEVLGCVEETSFDNIEKGCRAGVLELLRRHPSMMHWSLVIRAPREDDRCDRDSVHRGAAVVGNGL